MVKSCVPSAKRNWANKMEAYAKGAGCSRVIVFGLYKPGNCKYVGREDKNGKESFQPHVQ